MVLLYFYSNTLVALLKTSRFVVLLSRRISRDCGGAPFYSSLDIDKPNVYASLLRRRWAYNDSRLRLHSRDTRLRLRSRGV